MECHVNTIIDLTVGINTHNLLMAPTPTPTPTPVFSIEMLTTQLWPPGYALGQNKFSTTVLHKNLFMVLDGHDIGMLIPDVTIPFANQWYAVMWPFSSRKVMFSASTVKMDGQPTGCASILGLFPMMTCGDPMALPSSFPLTNCLNTVIVGLTFKDIVMGWLKIAVSMVIDVVFYKPAKATTALDALIKKLLPPTTAEGWTKKMLKSLSGAAFSIFEGEPEVGLDIGMTGIAEVGITSKPGDVTMGPSFFGGGENRAGFGFAGEGHVTRDLQGRWGALVNGVYSGSDDEGE